MLKNLKKYGATNSDKLREKVRCETTKKSVIKHDEMLVKSVQKSLMKTVKFDGILVTKYGGNCSKFDDNFSDEIRCKISENLVQK